ncbi:MAG: LacI family DNA-binding transcriptional regulator [Candidatus Omnitrophota bacterium]|nr:LacI family DNA-binding transcriptional regulator [Candidatus Omnitrophota bacterium]
MAKKKISIEDVARRAGVSITTVSRVINNVPTVSKTNRLKVEEAIRFFKFKPNISAQQLAKGESRAVGLIIPRYEGVYSSFYAVEIIRGVGSSCEQLKLDLLLHLTDGRELLNVSNLGGVIFADIIENRQQLESILEENIPCIVINNIIKDLPVNYLGIDNLKGAKTAVTYLVELGHKNIATITGSLITQCAQQRLEGYKLALKEKNVPLKEDYIEKGDFSRRSARVATLKLLDLTHPPTAIFVASDDMAQEAIAVIMEKGLKVPKDISVIGFDDNPASLYGPVSLTTMRQPLFSMAAQAVKELNAIMQGKKTTLKAILPTELVIRESCSHFS